MGAVPVDALHLRPHFVHVAENAHRADSIQNASPQRVLGLIAHEEDDGVGVGDVVFEVMQDASALAHARSRDDHHRIGHEIQVLGILHAADIAQQMEAEGAAVVVGGHEFAGLPVVTLGVQTEDLGHIHRQGRIHVDGELGDVVLGA